MIEIQKVKELWILMNPRSGVPIVACLAQDWREALKILELNNWGPVEHLLYVGLREKIPAWYFLGEDHDKRKRGWAALLAEQARRRSLYLVQVDYLS